MTKINFKFTPEQQERFTLIYSETKRIYPDLVKDTIMRDKTKSLIACTIINGDDVFKQTQTNLVNTEVFTEI
jgi:hypothetical protein